MVHWAEAVPAVRREAARVAMAMRDFNGLSNIWVLVFELLRSSPCARWLMPPDLTQGNDYQSTPGPGLFHACSNETQNACHCHPMG